MSRRILASCADLIRDKVDVRGVYVKRISETSDQRLAPKLKPVGQVASIDGDTLKLVDHRENTPTILASEAFPQARGEFFDRCVRALFPRHSATMLVNIEQARANFRQGKQLLDRLNAIREHIAKQKLPLPQGITCTLDDFLASVAKDDPHQFPKLHQARSPVYILDPAGSQKTCEWPPDKGLTRFGPYSSRGFTPNRPKVCVIYQRSRRGQVEEFLAKFREGTTTGRDGIQPFEKGFLRKYNLTGGIDFEYFPADNATADAYRKAARAAIAGGGPGGQKWHLCFVQTEERFKDLPVEQNPYMVCKAAFLTHQLPIQVFTIETTQLPQAQLHYALNNLALATYAKLNGTPWLLQSYQKELQEMVIGIGSARVGDSRLGPGQRVVGITTVFTGDGNYCLANLSRASGYESYREELLSTLRLAVSQVRSDLQWRTNKPVRLIFHLGFKQFCDDEIAAVKELGEFDAQYAFVQPASRTLEPVSSVMEVYFHGCHTSIQCAP